MKAFPLELGKMPTFATSNQYHIRCSSRKRHSIRKEEITLSLFTNNMIFYLENARDYTHEVRPNK